MTQAHILIVDDEEAQRLALKSFLGRRAYKVFLAANGDEALKIVRNETIDIVMTDFRMPGMSGLELLRAIKDVQPGIDVILMTAYGSVDDAVDIMKAGAYDYLTKPVDLDELESLLKRVKGKRLLEEENRQLREQLSEKFRFERIISQSGEMEAVLNIAGRVAKSKAHVLILGESGTGKELLAQAIHYASPRREKPFVTVNVAALAENIIESELFGHEKGAFTGAIHQRRGRFEEANGGTLFVDEVGDIPLSVQVKLLRAIQFGQIQRVGGSETIDVDVRIISATHRDLEAMIRDGQFREDLYYRLNVVAIVAPPLRKRRVDIPLLADHFIKRFARENEKEVTGIEREALDRLMKYDFPGNVRELENMMEHAVVMTRNSLIGREDLPAHLPSGRHEALYDPADLSAGHAQKMKAFEKAMIEEALKQSGGNKSAAARLLGITERHLRSRLEKLNSADK
ncbi:MAG TPA: sigma-54-dependent Fis family transcriptional regulator [Caldithrix abyssi]|uniref:DNA-binding transcriptional regulator NtrC n=1 Tax=Caldithrix abyssi TaxID=187145 RepID=A0A7V1LLH6_CALAY|nr:sigma-54-dependent Fis family transcriptional regulator [Caldithrix abyssi]